MSGRVRNCLLAAVSAVALIAALTSTASAAPPADPGPPGRYIVVLKDSVGDPVSVAAEHSRAYNAQVSFVYGSAIEGYAAVIPNDRVAALRSDSRVDFVSEDRPVEAVAQTLPTGVDRIDGEVSTKFASGLANGPAVAVIDTGSGPNAELNIRGGKNCSTGKSYNDGNGHGTHVAGTIGARNDATGVVGVAPGVPIYSVRVLNNSGSGSWSSVACGIDWVTANASALGIKVASMSLGGSGADDGNCGNSNKDALHKAICRSVAAGVTYVVAAGNNAANLAGFVPAAYDEVLSVTAISDSNGTSGGGGGAPSCRTNEGDDVPASFSNYATGTDTNHTIAAPGVCILSTWLNGGSNTISGTSMATPHVSGAAALCVASGGPCVGMTPAQVVAKLRADAAARPGAYQFTGSPTSGSKYYGYLVYAGGY